MLFGAALGLEIDREQVGAAGEQEPDHLSAYFGVAHERRDLVPQPKGKRNEAEPTGFGACSETCGLRDTGQFPITHISSKAGGYPISDGSIAVHS